MTIVYLIGRAQYGDLGTYSEPKSLEDKKYMYDLGIPAFVTVAPVGEPCPVKGMTSTSSRLYARWADNLFNQGNMVYDTGYIGPPDTGFPVRPAEDFGLNPANFPYIWRSRSLTQQHIYDVIPAIDEWFTFTLPSLASLGSLRTLDVGWLAQGKPMNPPIPDYPATLSHNSTGTGPGKGQASPKYFDGTRTSVAFFPQYNFSPMHKIQYQTSVNATWRDATVQDSLNYSAFKEIYCGMDVNEKVPTSITVNLRLAFVLNPSLVGVSRSFLCNSTLT